MTQQEETVQAPDQPENYVIDQAAAVVRFSESEAAIAKLREEATGLVVKDIKDHAGLKKVRETRLNVKRQRVDLQNYADELKRPAIDWLAKVNGQLKPLVTSMKDIEAPLAAEEDRIEQLKQKEKEKRIQERIDHLGKFEKAFDYAIVAKMSNADFKKYLKQAEAEYDLKKYNAQVAASQAEAAAPPPVVDQPHQPEIIVTDNEKPSGLAEQPSLFPNDPDPLADGPEHEAMAANSEVVTRQRDNEKLQSFKEKICSLSLPEVETLECRQLVAEARDVLLTLAARIDDLTKPFTE